MAALNGTSREDRLTAIMIFDTLFGFSTNDTLFGDTSGIDQRNEDTFFGASGNDNIYGD
ncbi:MAG: hypothetical protein AAFY02_14480 [Pseudomonadota bacterium]